MKKIAPFLTLLLACDVAPPALNGTPDRDVEELDEPEAPACDIGDRPSDDAVPTNAGWVEGALEDRVHTFKGIPYALPPTGERRFQPPQDASCWHGPRASTEYGPTCTQPRVMNIAGSFLAEQSEDCLTLNVWSETLDAEAKRPVMVFIHGGANVVGSAADLLPYDGKSWARDFGVVFVTLQYRLGALGFLAHPELSAESDFGASGNYAHLDQVKALEWVQENIARFGGDPDQVMIFGESAGAFNTCMLLASPLASGLFHSALIESGECALIQKDEAETRGALHATELGCDDADDQLACLRALPASAFEGELSLDPSALGGARGWNDLPWVPNLDGHVFLDEPLETFRRGEHNQVPVVIGSNAHETELFTPPEVVTCGQVEDLATELLGEHADAVLERYPCSDYTLPRQAFVDASTDFMFTCPARRVARALTEGSDQPVWRYYYRHIRWDPALAGMRAFHASELMLLFDSYDRFGYIPPEGEHELSDLMRAAWSDLAVHGDPSVTSGAWSRYEVERDNALALEAGMFEPELEELTGIAADDCDFWDGLR
jgi:para-nitrobenzyl esterase